MTNIYGEKPSPEPSITLRKGKTEIKVQNAAAILRKISDMYPNESSPWNYHRRQREYDNVQKDRQIQWTKAAKDWFKTEMFGGTEDFEVIVNEPSESEPTKQTPPFVEEHEEVTPPKIQESVEPTIIKSTNRNAYEIRTDILGMALSWVQSKNTSASEDDVLNVAQKFYKFVENRR